MKLSNSLHTKKGLVEEAPRGHSITKYVDKMREGRKSKTVCFCPRSGYKNCPRRGGPGGGLEKWQNSVHVVVE